MEFAQLAHRLIARHELSFEESQALMRLMVSGEATDGQIGAALGALMTKGVTSGELQHFAEVLREHCVSVKTAIPNLVDTCGTGGGAPSFNISTAAAIIASAAGAVIAKHGNRGVTSPCGSADVLEAHGVRLGLEPEKILHLIEEIGIAFMFAPSHHPAMRHVGKVRKELGFRTVFNMLGPLLNPAGASRQLVGVFDPNILRSMAEALAGLGAERAFVVHGNDGLDEISPVTSTYVAEVEAGKVCERTLQPEDFGLDPLEPEAVAPGQTLEQNAKLLEMAISDANSHRCQAALPSAAAALYLAGTAATLREGTALAREAVASGLARAKLEQLVEASQAP